MSRVSVNGQGGGGEGSTGSFDASSINFVQLDRL